MDELQQGSSKKLIDFTSYQKNSSQLTIEIKIILHDPELKIN